MLLTHLRSSTCLAAWGIGLASHSLLGRWWDRERADGRDSMDVLRATYHAIPSSGFRDVGHPSIWGEHLHDALQEAIADELAFFIEQVWVGVSLKVAKADPEGNILHGRWVPWGASARLLT